MADMTNNDGPKKVENELERSNRELQEEFQAWPASGLDPENVQTRSFGIWLAEQKLNAVIQILLKHNVCSEAEMQIVFNDIASTNLKALRELILENQQENAIHVPQPEIVERDTTLLGPTGKPLYG